MKQKWLPSACKTIECALRWTAEERLDAWWFPGTPYLTPKNYVWCPRNTEQSPRATRPVKPLLREEADEVGQVAAVDPEQPEGGNQVVHSPPARPRRPSR